MEIRNRIKKMFNFYTGLPHILLDVLSICCELCELTISHLWHRKAVKGMCFFSCEHHQMEQYFRTKRQHFVLLIQLLMQYMVCVCEQSHLLTEPSAH